MGYLYKDLSDKIYDCLFTVHRALGPGLLESIYELCLKKELEDAGLFVEQQKPVPLTYKGIIFETGYRIDLMVDKKIILELKAVETMNPVYQAQLLTYLKLSEMKLGLVVNFNVALIKNGITRVILT
ncbi:GxxExxY protein [Haliscomenobacter hydrossis]|uniref:GxxExxY protein n=1 Tax=Haliscomenobacter hydrossis (strain ATCC 27775 / DSM 1100 / LMG 10767 / O) TaxID=760192 RepID=F4L4D2_HALH1|nr:GxxExxY protein [Haliscomenobacter hydrossis]AEE51801.1 hypothetical protein Halhy_3953 [Haliscomenobacter hydrossis DSM 1100]